MPPVVFVTAHDQHAVDAFEVHALDYVLKPVHRERFNGAIDRVVGGPGLRRGRRHPSDLFIGEAVDFWRVEEVRSDALVRLRAEMKLPGRAWLQWEMRECDDATKTELKQTAIYAPRGLWGMLYWWASYPFHLFIFRDMVREIARRAEKRAAGRFTSATASAL